MKRAEMISQKMKRNESQVFLKRESLTLRLDFLKVVFSVRRGIKVTPTSSQHPFILKKLIQHQYNFIITFLSNLTYLK